MGESTTGKKANAMENDEKLAIQIATKIGVNG